MYNLKAKYEDAPPSGPIVARLVECYESSGSDLRKAAQMNSDDYLSALEKIIDDKTYCPNLYEIFHQWRTLYQSNNYGVSNWSIIPNDTYIEKRWKVVNTIKEYLKEHPNDKWAKWQIVFLMDLPIIQRGGMFGNTNLNHIAYLFHYGD